MEFLRCHCLGGPCVAEERHSESSLHGPEGSGGGVLQTDPGVLPPPVITKLPHARFVPILWLPITMKDERWPL